MPSAFLPPGRNVSRVRVVGTTPADATGAKPKPAAITTAATAASFLNRLNMTLSLREYKLRPCEPRTAARFRIGNRTMRPRETGAKREAAGNVAWRAGGVRPVRAVTPARVRGASRA